MRTSSAFRLASGALLATGAVAAVAFLPVADRVERLLEWARGAGPLGPLALVLAYVVGCLLLVPGSILTLGAGFVFGVVEGTIAASAGSTLGATAAFLAGRTVARPLVEARVAKDPRFLAIDRAVGERGWRIVLLTRLSPLFPFNLQNYAWGLTSVRLRDYVPASWIGMFPGTLLYVYLGSAARSLADAAAGKLEGEGWRWVLFAVGLAATVAVTAYVARIARRALAEAAPPPPPPSPPSQEGT